MGALGGGPVAVMGRAVAEWEVEVDIVRRDDEAAWRGVPADGM